MGFPSGSDGKESTCNVGDLGVIPRSGRSPGEGNGNPLQYSCLENPMDRGVWRATVHGVTKNQTRPSTYAWMHCIAILNSMHSVPLFSDLSLAYLIHYHFFKQYTLNICTSIRNLSSKYQPHLPQPSSQSLINQHFQCKWFVNTM